MEDIDKTFKALRQVPIDQVTVDPFSSENAEQQLARQGWSAEEYFNAAEKSTSMSTSFFTKSYAAGYPELFPLIKWYTKLHK